MFFPKQKHNIKFQNNKTEQVTIIIPAYNEAENIARCLKSINDGNYPIENMEIIVVDNGSHDETRKIAREYGAIVLVDESKTVAGLRNLGAERAKGKILAFLDADCTVSENWLNAAVKVMENGEIAITGSRLNAPLSGNWIEKIWSMHLQCSSGKDGYAKYINSGNLFIKQKIFKEIGGFTESLISNEDVDICDKTRRMGYNIFHSKNIVATHWGYPRTIGSFIKREVWHGMGDATSNFPKIWKSKPLVLSVYNCFCIIAALTIFINYSKVLGIASVSAVFLPPIFLGIKTSRKAGEFRHINGLVSVYFMYSIARTLALLQFVLKKINCYLKKYANFFLHINNIPIIVYHKLCKQSQNRYSIEFHDFQQHLEYFKRKNYRTLGLEEYYDEMCKKNIGELSKCVLITFDDGYESDISRAMPLLLRYGFKATFFITTDWINKPGYLNDQDIKQLVQKGMSIGSHGKSHIYLDEKDVDVDFELRESKQRLEQITGRTMQFISFPGGRYNHRVIEASKSAGYRLVCSSMPFYLKNGDRLPVIGRSMVKYRGDGKTNFSRIINISYVGKMIMQLSYTFKLLLKVVFGNKLYLFIWQYYNRR